MNVNQTPELVARAKPENDAAPYYKYIAFYYRHISVVICIFSSALILSGPAILNGFPFVFSDSGVYLESALNLNIPHDRPVYYSILTAILHWKLSPWPIVLFQSILICALIRLIFRSIFAIRNPAAVLAASIILTCTSLPWFVGQIMPDIFTSVLVLALLLIVMGWPRLDVAERAFSLALVALCISMHNGNFLITLVALPAVGALYAAGWRAGPQALRRLALSLAAIAVGVVSLVGANLAARGQLTISSGAPVFLFAKLLDDGPALTMLENECPEKHYAACAQLERIEAYRANPSEWPRATTLSDFFLWEGPLESLGWFSPSFEAEAKLLNTESLRYVSWPRQAGVSLGHAARQFVSVETGDGLTALSKDEQPSPAILKIFGEKVYSDYANSMQERGLLDFSQLNRLHRVLLILSALVLATLSVTRWRDDKSIAFVSLFTLVFLMGNATVTGVLSAVHDRYQSRVIWIVPLLACAALLKTYVQRDEEATP